MPSYEPYEEQLQRNLLEGEQSGQLHPREQAANPDLSA
jgi:hypothetical protein